MGTGLQHDMASCDGLAQMSDLALFSAFNQNFHLHLTCIIHQWGKENFYRYSKSSLSLFTQRHFSGYVVTRGLRVGWEVMYCRVPRTCTFWNAFPTRL